MISSVAGLGRIARVAPKVRAFDDTPAAHRFVIPNYVRVKLDDSRIR